MRILVASSPGVGHLLPLLPLARAARGRGHDVRIATGQGLAGIVARTGFRHVPAGPASLPEVFRAIPEMAGLTGRRRAVVMVREGFAGRIARGIADDLLAAMGEGRTGDDDDAWRPDLIIHEDMELGSWVVAERLGIPHVTVQVTAWRPRVRELMASSVVPLAVAYGLGPDSPDRLLGRVFFSTRPRSMHDPDAPLPEMTAELRPISDDRDAAPPAADPPPDPFPPASDPAAAATARARVAVTLGTVNADQVGTMRTLVEGATAGGAVVAVALGNDPATFGPVPARVAVHRYVPMSTLLPRAHLVAFHGGSGTLTAALAAARPMLVVPIAADQLDNAERVVARGLGRSIPHDDITAAAVAEAIQAILADPAYRRAAEEVAAEIAEMPGPEAAIHRLEAEVQP